MRGLDIWRLNYTEFTLSSIRRGLDEEVQEM